MPNPLFYGDTVDFWGEVEGDFLLFGKPLSLEFGVRSLELGVVETQCLRLFEEVGGRICRDAMLASWMGLSWRGAAVGRDLRLGDVSPFGRWGGAGVSVAALRQPYTACVMSCAPMGLGAQSRRDGGM